MPAEMENQVSQTSSNESKPFSEHARTDELVVKLARFFSVMGNQPSEPGALALMAEVLCSSATDDQIAQAMTRCCRECRFPVRLSDFLQRIPGQEIPQPEAEGRKAWDTLQTFVRKYVGNSIHGEYGPEHGWYPKTFPALADRILDTVRRSGGWKVYKCMTDADFPYVQKRFFEEYAAWTAVERVNPDHMLGAVVESKLLTAHAIPTQIKPVVQPRTFAAKTVPQLSTDAQLRERREMLAQQATALHQRRVQRHTAHSANPNSESESSAPLRIQEQAHAS